MVQSGIVEMHFTYTAVPWKNVNNDILFTTPGKLAVFILNHHLFKLVFPMPYQDFCNRKFKFCIIVLKISIFPFHFHFTPFSGKLLISLSLRNKVLLCFYTGGLYLSSGACWEPCSAQVFRYLIWDLMELENRNMWKHDFLIIFLLLVTLERDSQLVLFACGSPQCFP